MKKVTQADFKDATKEGVVLVDFYADWCGPCKMLGPVLEDIAKEYEGKAEIVKVNVDEEQALAMQYGVQSIPSLKLFKDGKLVDETMGFQPKPSLTAMIDKAL